MRLASFIRAKMEPILQEWEDFVRSLGATTSGMDMTAMRDHAELMLEAIANDLETPQSSGEQAIKSKGRAPSRDPGIPPSVSSLHGMLRAEEGFTLVELISEYRALRAIVLRLWARGVTHLSTSPAAETFDDQIRFDDAIDEALANSVLTYSLAVEQMFETKARRRMENLGTLAAGLGHDMTNILLPMRCCLESLTPQDPSCKSVPAVAALQVSVRHLARVTNGLTALSEDPDAEISMAASTVLHEWWEASLKPFTWVLRKGVRLHVAGLHSQDPPLPPVAVPSHVLMHAVFGLVQTSARAFDQRRSSRPPDKSSPSAVPFGNIWITASSEADSTKPSEGGWVRLTIRDDGPGIDPDKVFRSSGTSTTANPKDQASGLGLYLVRNALERCGGTFSFESRAGGGTLCTLLLPVARAKPVTITKSSSVSSVLKQ